MNEEKKSIDKLQEQETNTDEVKGGFKKHLKVFKQNRKSDGDHMSKADRSKNYPSNEAPASEGISNPGHKKLGARNFKK